MRHSLFGLFALCSLALHAQVINLTTELVPQDTDFHVHFGWTVAVSGNTVVASDPFTITGGTPGAARVYVKTASGWVQQAKLRPASPIPNQNWGLALAIDGDTLAVGGNRMDGSATTPLSVYVYVRSGNTWTLQAELAAPRVQAVDNFGASLAISGDTLLVGSSNEDNGGNNGAVYVYRRTGSTWALESKIVRSDGLSGFGHKLALDGDTAVISTINISDTPRVFVYARTGLTWSEEAVFGSLLPFNFYQDIYYIFGRSVAIEGNMIVVGSIADSAVSLVNRPGDRRGAFYVYRKNGGVWGLEERILSPSDIPTQFSIALDINDQKIYIGAAETSVFEANAALAGVVYVYGKSGGNWLLESTLRADDPFSLDHFGQTLGVSDSVVAIGASQHDHGLPNGSEGNPGAVYILEQNVVANFAPSINCSSPSSVECSSSSGTLTPLSATVSDLNGDALTVQWRVDSVLVQTTNVPAAGPPTTANLTLVHTLSDGPHTVTVSVSDGNAPAVSCTSTVTVSDTTPPAITLNGANPMTIQCGSAFVDPGATAADACEGNVPVTVSGSVAGVGSHTLTYSAADGHGNSSSVSRTVNVVDSQAPVPNVATLPTVSGQCSVTLSAPTAVDACEGTITGTTSDPTTYNTQGTFTVTWIYVDGNGNATTQTQMVVVRDTQAPTIVCPAAKTVPMDAGMCSASNVSLGTPVVSDNCGIANVSNNAPATFPKGTTAVTWTVVDTNGNASSCTQNVTVQDTQPPVISCPPDRSVVATSPSGAVVNYPALTASDNCPGVGTNYSIPSGTTFPIGSTTVIATAVDSSGNESTCSFVVTVTAQSATSQVDILITHIISLNLPNGTENSLLAKLNQAKDAIASGNVNVACSSLQAFINEVSAQSGKKITVADANQLIAEATQIRIAINCP